MGKQFARAIVWSRWNIRIDNLGITCTEDIIISGSRATGPKGSYWIGPGVSTSIINFRCHLEPSKQRDTQRWQGESNNHIG